MLRLKIIGEKYLSFNLFFIILHIFIIMRIDERAGGGADLASLASPDTRATNSLLLLEEEGGNSRVPFTPNQPQLILARSKNGTK